MRLRIATFEVGNPFRLIPSTRMDPAPAPFERYPRIGFDRPKASDHCPLAVSLTLSGSRSEVR